MWIFITPNMSITTVVIPSLVKDASPERKKKLDMNCVLWAIDSTIDWMQSYVACHLVPQLVHVGDSTDRIICKSKIFHTIVRDKFSFIATLLQVNSGYCEKLFSTNHYDFQFSSFI